MKSHSSSDDSKKGELDVLLRNCIRGNELALKALKFLEEDQEIQEIIAHGNTLVIGRLNYNDHGPIHSRIASINALTVLQILHSEGIETTIEKEKWGDYRDSQVVVLIATYLHDMGNSIHREQHYQHVLTMANPILREFLPTLYSPQRSHRIRASILECMYSHDEGAQCLSIEGGCVTVGDGTDMANGRVRIPFSLGKLDIHSVSALSIENVKIVKGENKPILIEVELSESAGVFQIQNVLGKKIHASGIQKYIQVRGKVLGKDIGILDEIEF